MAEQQSAVIEWVDPKLLKPHKLSLQIYGEDSCEDLVESIRELGVLQPLYATPKGVIISGHRRWRAAEIAGKSVPVIRKSYPKPLDEQQAIIEFNRYRIKTGQQLYNEGKLLKEIEAKKAKFGWEQKHRDQPRDKAGKFQRTVENLPPTDEGKTRDIIAKTIGLGSGKQWDKLEYVAEHSPQLLTQIKPDGITITKAYKDAKQKQIVKPTKPPELPQGVFNVIVIDPPWPYSKRSSDTTHRARSPYPQMSIEEIKTNRPPCADDCIVWLWTTNVFMHEAFHVLETWNLEPKTILTWVKDKMGLGDWLRGQTEHCILAIKGKPSINLTNQTTFLKAKAREHSRKPDKFYQMVKRLCPGKRCDMYAREKRRGWTSHGNETEKFSG